MMHLPASVRVYLCASACDMHFPLGIGGGHQSCCQQLSILSTFSGISYYAD